MKNYEGGCLVCGVSRFQHASDCPNLSKLRLVGKSRDFWRGGFEIGIVLGLIAVGVWAILTLLQVLEPVLQLLQLVGSKLRD
ncbi:hypothetical protein LCGC14_2639580 [marine sediment metagenome]|uniref:Uncharacterized protein n=1 Tax=marine sediment metagenome TaxID=412755 RepID=A0A0F8ZXV5_9ZZZZ